MDIDALIDLQELHQAGVAAHIPTRCGVNTASEYRRWRHRGQDTCCATVTNCVKSNAANTSHACNRTAWYWDPRTQKSPLLRHYSVREIPSSRRGGGGAL